MRKQHSTNHMFASSPNARTKVDTTASSFLAHGTDLAWDELDHDDLGMSGGGGLMGLDLREDDPERRARFSAVSMASQPETGDGKAYRGSLDSVGSTSNSPRRSSRALRLTRGSTDSVTSSPRRTRGSMDSGGSPRRPSSPRSGEEEEQEEEDRTESKFRTITKKSQLRASTEAKEHLLASERFRKPAFYQVGASELGAARRHSLPQHHERSPFIPLPHNSIRRAARSVAPSSTRSHRFAPRPIAARSGDALESGPTPPRTLT